MTDPFNPIDFNSEFLSGTGSRSEEYKFNSTLPEQFSITDLENDDEFMTRANRFLEGVGRNENIFEYLRDSEYSLSSAAKRSFEVGNWSDQEKQDYLYLTDKFSKAKLKGINERIAFAKDFAIDTITDPVNIAAMIFAPFTLGSSFAIKKAAVELAKNQVKKYTTSQLTKQAVNAAKRPAIFTAVEGASWTGAHDFFNQSTEVKVDPFKTNIEFDKVALSTLLGGIIGGAAGGVIGGISGAKYFDKVFKYSNEDSIAKATKNITRINLEDDFVIEDSLSPNPSKIKEYINKPINFLFGKTTREFVDLAKRSKTLTDLLYKFRYDFNTSVLGKAGAKLIDATYGEFKGRLTGYYLANLEKGLNNLDRVAGGKGVINRLFSGGVLTENDNRALLAAIMDPKTKQFKNTAGEMVDISDDIKNAASKIQELNNEIFDEGLAIGLFEKFQRVKNYFPRMFKYSAISSVKGREDFKKLLVNSGHADPINEIPTKTFISEIDGKTVKLKGIEENTVSTDAELFNGRDFLKEAGGNQQKAKELKADAIIDNMLSHKHTPFEFRKTGQVGGGSAFLKNRVFTNISDKDIAPFIETDVEKVLKNYYMNASQTIARAKYFGKTLGDFETNYVTKIRTELEDLGVDEEVINQGLSRLRNMYEKVTGLDPTSTQYNNGFFREFSNWGRLFQQMAHLPLATISSITEPIILLQRAGFSETPAIVKDLSVALGKNFLRDMNKAFGQITRVVGGKTKGKGAFKSFDDLDDEQFFEIYETGLALEQAVMDRIEGLTGDALTNDTAKVLQNAFFKLNLLDSWTRTVQLASFTMGKRIINRNSQKLFEYNTGIGNISKAQASYYENQLVEIGVDPVKAQQWYQRSLDENFIYDHTKGMQDSFYKKDILGGANRFVKEVILNPSTAEANRPLWFSSPTGQILMQFAGYPTVFNNTVLKRFVKEVGTLKGAPKTIGTALTMTAVAVLGDYIRSRGRSVTGSELSFSEMLAGKGLENVSDDTKRLIENAREGRLLPFAGLGETLDDSQIIARAIRRWGGFGPFDYGSRFSDELDYNRNLLVAAPKSVAGPLAQDFFDTIKFGTGIGQLATSNMPGAAAIDLIFGEGTLKDIREKGREFDKELYEMLVPDNKRGRIFDGGEVSKDVTNVPDEPNERVDKFTGLPYDVQAGGAYEDFDERNFRERLKKIFKSNNEEERTGFSEGGSAKLFGRDGIIFDYTNPLDYLMFIPGAGVIGIAAKSLSTAGKLNKLKTLPKTQYHGGFTTVEKGVANKRGIYTSPDISLARAFSVRGGDESKRLTSKKRVSTGVYQIDLSLAKNVELIDKPSKELTKVLNNRLKELKNIPFDKKTKRDKRLQFGIEYLFPNLTNSSRSMTIQGKTPINAGRDLLNFLRKNNVEVLTDSFNFKRLGVGEGAEFFLLKDFPKKKLSKEKVRELFDAAMRERIDFAEGGTVSNVLVDFLNEALRASDV